MHLLSKVTELALDVLLKLTPDAQQASSQNLENRVTACETSNSLDGDQPDVTLWANASRKMGNESVTVEVKVSIGRSGGRPDAAGNDRDGLVDCIARLTCDSTESFCSVAGHSARAQNLKQDLEDLRTEQLYTKVALIFEQLKCDLLTGTTFEPARARDIVIALVSRVIGSEPATASELTAAVLLKALEYLRGNNIRNLGQLGKLLGLPPKQRKPCAPNEPSTSSVPEAPELNRSISPNPETSSQIAPSSADASLAKEDSKCSGPELETPTFGSHENAPAPEFPNNCSDGTAPAAPAQSNPTDSPQQVAKHSGNPGAGIKPDWLLLKAHLLSVLNEMPAQQLKSALKFLNNVRRQFAKRASERQSSPPRPDDLPLFQKSTSSPDVFKSGGDPLRAERPEL